MFHDILFLLLGLTLLVIGANWVTDGSVAVARRFNVSNLIIGLTVVAIGSTMPDIVVCVESAMSHKSTIALGEVIGANIFDLLLVVGLMAIVRPFKVSQLMRGQDLPILLIASASLWIAGDTILFDNVGHNIVTRSAGLMLIIIFIFYMWFMILSSRGEKNLASESDSGVTQTETPVASADKFDGGIAHAHSYKAGLTAIVREYDKFKGRQWFSWLLIVVGLGALVVGGNWVVSGASGLAVRIGMSQAMVALTVVAIGNALPDLVTSLTASLKGACSLALGNIVGSCIINALLTIGLSSIVIPLDGDTIGFVDFFTLVGASALIWVFPLISRQKMLGRTAGVVLCMLYVAYMVFTIMRG